MRGSGASRVSPQPDRHEQRHEEIDGRPGHVIGHHERERAGHQESDPVAEDPHCRGETCFPLGVAPRPPCRRRRPRPEWRSARRIRIAFIASSRSPSRGSWNAMAAIEISKPIWVSSSQPRRRPNRGGDVPVDQRRPEHFQRVRERDQAEEARSRIRSTPSTVIHACSVRLVRKRGMPEENPSNSSASILGCRSTVPTETLVHSIPVPCPPHGRATRRRPVCPGRDDPESQRGRSGLLDQGVQQDRKRSQEKDDRNPGIAGGSVRSR